MVKQSVYLLMTWTNLYRTYLIFVTHPTNIFVEKKFAIWEISAFHAWWLWRNLKFIHMWINSDVKIQMWKFLKFLHLCGVIYTPWHGRCGEVWNAFYAENVVLYMQNFCCFDVKSGFVAIYALLLQNLWIKNDRYEVCCRRGMSMKEIYSGVKKWWESPNIIHSKSDKVCGICFSVSKNLRKKCVNRDKSA